MYNAPATRPANQTFQGLRGLLPQYNAKANTFWVLTVLAGMAALGWSIHQVMGMDTRAQVQIVLGVSIAALAGFFPLRMPGNKVVFFAGETFIFSLLLLHGAPAAIIAASAEAIVLSLRITKQPSNHPFSSAINAGAMYLASLSHEEIVRVLSHDQAIGIGAMAVVTASTAIVFMGTTVLMIVFMLSLRGNNVVKCMQYVRSSVWVMVNCAGAALVATALFQVYRITGNALIFAAGPALLMLLSTIHFYVGSVRVAIEAQRATAEAARREAEFSQQNALEMARSEQRFEATFTHATIGMALVTIDGVVVKANQAFDALFSTANGAVAETSATTVQLNVAECVESQHRQTFLDRMRDAQRYGQTSLPMEVRCTLGDGRAFDVSVYSSVFSGSHAQWPCVVLQVQDISLQKVTQASIEHLSQYDSLTGLANRKLLRSLLDANAARAADAQGHHFALIALSCDRFKKFHDGMGPSFSDRYLVAFSRRITQEVRPTDVVARVGTDEFAVLVELNDGPTHAGDMARRLLESARLPLRIDGLEISSTVSVGWVASDDDHRTSEALMRDADIALHHARASGQDRVVAFEPAMRERTNKRFVIESELKSALAHDRLTLHYQPLYDIGTHTIIGFEALARWFHPTLGFISPAEFIPVAEETGVVVDLTAFVLREATQQLARWQRMDDAFAELQMHVNLSGLDLAQGDLDRRVLHALTSARIQPHHLVLEITESILMESVDGGFAMAERLRGLGVELAIDDFGTGFSSLSNLARLPISSIKIDASFVRELAPSTPQEAIVKSVIALARSINKSVIAEGIETAAQRDLLVAMGCRGGQGYLMARPMPRDAVTSLLGEACARKAPPSRRSAGTPSTFEAATV